MRWYDLLLAGVVSGVALYLIVVLLYTVGHV